jgi:hypothetical protein
MASHFPHDIRLCNKSLTLVPVTGRITSPYRRPLHTKRKSALEYFVVVGYGKGSHFMHLLPNALHLTLQARYLLTRRSLHVVSARSGLLYPMQ